MCLAFGCKDCESIFVVFSLGNEKEISFLQTVQVQREVTGRIDASIGEQLVDDPWRAVINTFYVAEVMDGAEHLVGFSGE